MTEPVRPLEALIAELLSKWGAIAEYEHDERGNLQYAAGIDRCAEELESLLQAAAPPAPTAEQRVTRLEVVDESGRAFTRWGCKIELSYQDRGRTLKVFVEPDPSAAQGPAPGWLDGIQALARQAANRIRESGGTVDTADLKSAADQHAGSTPASRTNPAAPPAPTAEPIDVRTLNDAHDRLKVLHAAPPERVSEGKEPK